MSVKQHLEVRHESLLRSKEEAARRKTEREESRKQKYERWNEKVRTVYWSLDSDREYLSRWGCSPTLLIGDLVLVVLEHAKQNLVIAYTDEYGFELHRRPPGEHDIGEEGSAQYFWDERQLEEAVASAIAEASEPDA